MSTTDLIEDADLAVTDAHLVLAGVTELSEYMRDGGADQAAIADLTLDLLPKIDALRAYLIEQAMQA